MSEYQANERFHMHLQFQATNFRRTIIGLFSWCSLSMDWKKNNRLVCLLIRPKVRRKFHASISGNIYPSVSSLSYSTFMLQFQFLLTFQLVILPFKILITLYLIIQIITFFLGGGGKKKKEKFMSSYIPILQLRSWAHMAIQTHKYSLFIYFYFKKKIHINTLD